MRGIVVDDLDIGGQSGARVGAFDQIVAEERVAREALVEHRHEARPLRRFPCREDAFAVEILVDVGDCAGVYIEAGLAGVDARRAASETPSDADSDARLENSVAFGDDAEIGIDDGAVERMRHRADHAAAVPRGSCVSESSVMM